MKTVNKIPTSKISRASQLMSTGAKVGVNYLNYYKDKITKSEEQAREKLHESNAEDIYDGLSNLKGSALKVIQMLSTDKNLLPQEYTDKFSLAQFSVPPLSAPLVNKTFKQYFGKYPNEIFDEFNLNSVNAASIGQVHKAVKDGNEYAVKIQYPGVAESVSSDLKMVKPIAVRMFNLQGKDSERYFKEVENKLIEETDYVLELEQSQSVAETCKHIPNIKFPEYYPHWSSERIITMDYMHGKHWSEYTAPDRTTANKIGQALWDFYMYQFYVLKKVHADPHPGNFLISEDNELIVLDFGCMKSIPDEFHKPYFELKQPEILNDPQLFREKMYELEILKPSDTQQEQKFFGNLFHELTTLFALPFQQPVFNFADPDFFNRIFAVSDKYAKMKENRKYNGNRGSEHFIYMSRTFFGLYNLLHQIGADAIETRKQF